MGVRHRIIHERTGHQLTVIVVNRAFEQSLTDPLCDTAVYLAFDNHRIDEHAAVFEPMTASGGRDVAQGATSVGAGLRLVPTWISSLTLRIDASRLLAPEPAWFLQLGLTQYL